MDGLDVFAKEADEVDERLKVVDGRADPYTTRPQVTYTKEDRLRDILKEEKTVERIVRSRTWNVVENRCEDTGDSWEEALAKWRREER